MRSILAILALVLAGCAGPAPTEEPLHAAEPGAREPLPPDDGAAVQVVEPSVIEFELSATCSFYVVGIYARPCANEGDFPSTSHMQRVSLDNATALVVEVELTEGDEGQLLAGEGRSSFFHRETVTTSERFVLTGNDWGELAEIVFELQGASHEEFVEADVWASGPLRMDVTVTVFDERPDNLDTYCTRC